MSIAVEIPLKLCHIKVVDVKKNTGKSPVKLRPHWKKKLLLVIVISALLSLVINFIVYGSITFGVIGTIFFILLSIVMLPVFLISLFAERKIAPYDYEKTPFLSQSLKTGQAGKGKRMFLWKVSELEVAFRHWRKLWRIYSTAFVLLILGTSVFSAWLVYQKNPLHSDFFFLFGLSILVISIVFLFILLLLYVLKRLQINVVSYELTDQGLLLTESYFFSYLGYGGWFRLYSFFDQAEFDAKNNIIALRYKKKKLFIFRRLFIACTKENYPEVASYIKGIFKNL